MIDEINREKRITKIASKSEIMYPFRRWEYRTKIHNNIQKKPEFIFFEEQQTKAKIYSKNYTILKKS